MPPKVRGALLLVCLAGAPAVAQATRDLPFAPGERFTYAGSVRKGISGRGTLSVDAPTELRGTTTWVLRSDMEGRLGPFKATDQNASWLDPIRMSTLRYTTRERHLLARHDEAVDIFAAERRWTGNDGAAGELTISNPLDELSFLYYVRTLPLLTDSALTVTRHFDESRNPTVVRVVGREDIEVGAGRFHAVIVEMRVRDTRRYRGEGVIRVTLSDDRCRLILRLDSSVPDAGTATLALQSYEGMQWTCTAKTP